MKIALTTLFLALLALSFSARAQHSAEAFIEFTPSTPSLQIGGMYEYAIGEKWSLSLGPKIRVTRLLLASDEPFGFVRPTLPAPETKTFTLDIPLQLHRVLYKGSAISLRLGAGPEIRWEKGRVPFGTRTWVAQTAQALGFIASLDAVHRIARPIHFRYGIRLSQGLFSHYPEGENFVSRPTELGNGTQIAFQFGVRWSKS